MNPRERFIAALGRRPLTGWVPLPELTPAHLTSVLRDRLPSLPETRKRHVEDVNQMGAPIIIVPYDPEWPLLFADLGQHLREALGEVALRLDHIGSTSIPGMAAKPVIDVQISVASFEPLDAFKTPIEGLGFVHRATNPDLTKRYFRERPGQRCTHIHVRPTGSWPEQFALLFRDYMRTHDEDCRWYESIKRQLADQYRDDRQGYTNAKAPHLWEIMKKADLWSQATGRVASPSDF